MSKILVLLSLFAVSFADIYMHNPRGSNNRRSNDVNNRNTDNQNRVFNSQNNAKGGYEWGPPMTYHSGSQLTIEWAAQHECRPNGSGNNHCNILLQYMCGPLVRDGTTSDTIEETPAADNDLQYGRHESYASYEKCDHRERNMGLFTADQELNGNTAEYTRQNPNKNRRGFECQEERDYYPYWHPTEWRDIAVYVSEPTMCNFYEVESQNVKEKYECEKPYHEFNNEADCTKNGVGVWKATDSWGLPPPVCGPAPPSRDNHLGSGEDGYLVHYNWTIPYVGSLPSALKTRLDAMKVDHEARLADSDPSNDPTWDELMEPRRYHTVSAADAVSCLVRVRYNITTSDYDSWTTDFRWNDEEPNTPPMTSPIYDDPYVEWNWPGQFLQMAIDTTQFGRTFQDRSHTFKIAPDTTTCAKIWNLNVRGKRGNIQQVYPSVQYDFVPNRLVVKVGECVHWQWTGGDSNPENNFGRGADSTDRHNVCQINDLKNNTCVPITQQTLFSTVALAEKFAHLGQTGCQTMQQLFTEHANTQTGVANLGEVMQDNGNCMILNAASQYFNNVPIKMNTPGVYHYMCTRNNYHGMQFQKGTIVVEA